ncbi:MAG: N-acetylglucosamine-6-phosphate deacetylase [Chitinophagaceae bacterium]|nr:N-acetylglucosamine-6-phosphate deacetylase [Chitinophagaceae bacterium]
MERSSIVCKNCITGDRETVTFGDHNRVSINKANTGEDSVFIGPGLIDLQINGIRGIDFNISSVSVEDLVNTTRYLLSEGVTTFFPTVITNSDEEILAIMRTIASACEKDPLVNACIGGIHLEGPFISPQPGARGAHNEAFIKPPDWELFNKFQEAAGGRIKIITLAPEWEGAPEFIKQCVRSGVIVSIGHSLADTAQIRNAVKAGARMSTHLGNGIPLMVQRHPNLIWDQLAEDDLYACIIADGIHIPDSFIKVVQKVKADAAMIVSDATCFAGMEPGEYRSHIGGYVVLEKNKRLSVKGGGGVLAGAAKSILENIETLLEHQLCDLGAAWQMASSNITRFLHACGKGINNIGDDHVIFTLQGTSVHVQKVIKGGKVVFGN